MGTPGCARPTTGPQPAHNRPTTGLDGVPVYLTGSDSDPWIPTQAFAQTFEALSLARAHQRADSFPGRPHEVSAAKNRRSGPDAERAGRQVTD